MPGFNFFAPAAEYREPSGIDPELHPPSPARNVAEANPRSVPYFRSPVSPVYSPGGLSRRLAPHGPEAGSAAAPNQESDRLQAFLESAQARTVNLASVGSNRSANAWLVAPVGASGGGRSAIAGAKAKAANPPTPKGGQLAAATLDSHAAASVSVSVSVGHGHLPPAQSPREDMPQVGGQVKTSATPRSHQAGLAAGKAWGMALNTISESSSAEEKSRKGRPYGSFGAALGWVPARGVEALHDSVRWGARTLSDSFTRKRSPLSLRLLIALVLTGFITVIVSYRTLSPSLHLSHPRDKATEMLILQDLIAESTQSQSSRTSRSQPQTNGNWLGVDSQQRISEANVLPGAGDAGALAASGLSSGSEGRLALGQGSVGFNPDAHSVDLTASTGTAGTARTLSSLLAALRSNAARLSREGSAPGAQSAIGAPDGAIPARLVAVPEHQRKLWLPVKSHNLGVCIDRPKKHKEPYPLATNGYLIVTANGGLNQMRAAICDMVAVARIMNATLVLPQLDHSSFWADPSEFEDIFQLDHFVNELKRDIRIVKELPPSHQHLKPLEIFPVSWSPFAYYRNDLLKKLKKHHVMVFPLTDSRLANNNLPESIQRLRCRANYRALKYTLQIEAVASRLVERLRAKGPYIALHLRYEKDMLAFTGCTHGLTADEGEELRVMRFNNSRWKEKQIDGEQRRQEGLCPLTPGETALFLKALGFPNTSVIYIAAGDIYGSNGLKDLTTVYPNTYTHATLATAEELEALEKYQNRMAAVDYTVAVESDVFVYTYEGNMARAVQGHRRFEGHRKTIMPDRRLVVQYIDMLNKGLLTWSQFRRSIKQSHRDKLGGPHLRLAGLNPKIEENFFANPYPGCICEGQPTASF